MVIYDKRKLTFQLPDKLELSFFFEKIIGKNNSLGKLLGIILPIVFVAVVAAIILCIWIVCKKRISQGTKLTHRSKLFV